MPCFTALARRLNLFSRDASELTRADVTATYIFLLVAIYTIGWYTQKYIRLASRDFDACRVPSNHTVAFCVKDGLVHNGVLCIGVLNGFVIALFRGINMVAVAINYACCCSYCCVPEDNPNSVPAVVRVELEPAQDNVIRA